MIGVLNAQTMTTSSGCFDDYIYLERRDDVSVRDDNDDFEDDDKNAHNTHIKDEEKNKETTFCTISLGYRKNIVLYRETRIHRRYI